MDMGDIKILSVYHTNPLGKETTSFFAKQTLTICRKCGGEALSSGPEISFPHNQDICGKEPGQLVKIRPIS
jgi:hypothetical protein